MRKEEITTLFLDIGGVLLSNGWDHEFRQLAIEKFHLDKNEIEERHGIMFVAYEEGKVTLEEYLKRVVFFKKRNFTELAFREFMFSLSTADLEMIGFVNKLKDQYGLKVVAVSNEARELNAYRIQKFNLAKTFDFFISSCYVHLRKPDKLIFQMALDTANVSPGQVVYIDDQPMFVDISADLGITSICHTDYLSTLKALKKIGLHLNKNKMYE